MELVFLKAYVSNTSKHRTTGNEIITKDFSHELLIVNLSQLNKKVVIMKITLETAKNSMKLMLLQVRR